MHTAIDTDDPAAALVRAAEILRDAKRIVVMTGAGISAESGIPTFRDADGLWEGHAVEDVATPDGFFRDPKLVWRFYNERRENLRAVEPNPGHFALAQLEAAREPGRVAIITQNVDGLHRRAGSRRIIELHGNLARTRCTGCELIQDQGLSPLGELPRCEQCDALLRPDVVWFTESLPDDAWESALQAIGECECCIVAGTSAVVYPAAGLISTARLAGARILEFNLTRTAASHLADVSVLGPSGKTLPKTVELAR